MDLFFFNPNCKSQEVLWSLYQCKTFKSNILLNIELSALPRYFSESVKLALLAFGIGTIEHTQKSLIADPYVRRPEDKFALCTGNLILTCLK
jgi:hypothetical protein